MTQLAAHTVNSGHCCTTVVLMTVSNLCTLIDECLLARPTKAAEHALFPSELNYLSHVHYTSSSTLPPGTHSPHRLLSPTHLVLVLLVVLKKALDLCQSVAGQLTDVGEVLEGRVITVHSNDLVILLALVKHAHHTNGLHLDTNTAATPET